MFVAVLKLLRRVLRRWLSRVSQFHLRSQLRPSQLRSITSIVVHIPYYPRSGNIDMAVKIIHMHQEIKFTVG